MPTETSKKMAWFSIWFSAVIVTACLIMLGFGINTIGFMGIFIAYPVASLGFYNWKAKAENVEKIAQSFKRQE